MWLCVYVPCREIVQGNKSGGEDGDRGEKEGWLGNDIRCRLRVLLR